ncbi:pectinesterase family protein [Vagococcus vulneris]|uniref:Uncharacterized protein n=1 Tax=Vagococcus vulneris TaxID=1977869 RepID=A0A429ZTC7_9ENTE|nr:pectinesterase family protein [Vagococcus vulneris]RST96938.1 hypothetical protein CBF37_10295 [Vagococcus vulneris]
MNFLFKKFLNNRTDADFKKNLNDNSDTFNSFVDWVKLFFNKTNTRIDNLVVNSGGDSPNEVVDARVDILGNAHASLSARLESDYDFFKVTLIRNEIDIKGLKNEVEYLNTMVNTVFGNINETISLYVSQSKGNNNNTGTEEKPFKTIQRAVDSIPKVNSANYLIIVDKGAYLENVKINNISNPSIIIKGYNAESLPQYPKDTGVYVRAIEFNQCVGYVGIFGLTQTDSKNASRFVRFSYCTYGVCRGCAIRENTKSNTNYNAIVYTTSGGHAYDNDISNQNRVFLAEFTSNAVFAMSNRGTDNTNRILSSRSIVYNANTDVKGEDKKEIGGQIY